MGSSATASPAGANGLPAGSAQCRGRLATPCPRGGTEGSNPPSSSGESGTNRTPSLRGRQSIHQLDRYRRDIRRLGRQRRYGFDCDVRGMIMPGIESRNQGGREHATQPDPDQNLACRTFAAAQGLGGHAGAASGRRNHRPCGDRRQGHAGLCIGRKPARLRSAGPAIRPNATGCSVPSPSLALRFGRLTSSPTRSFSACSMSSLRTEI